MINLIGSRTFKHISVFSPFWRTTDFELCFSNISITNSKPRKIMFIVDLLLDFTILLVQYLYFANWHHPFNCHLIWTTQWDNNHISLTMLENKWFRVDLFKVFSYVVYVITDHMINTHFELVVIRYY